MPGRPTFIFWTLGFPKLTPALVESKNFRCL
jgi:hypothetical protein